MSGRRSRIVTVLDQIASSASNFALVALVAHVSPAADFGRFSLAYVVLIFFLGLQRALIGEVLLVRFSGEDVDRSVFRAAAGLGTLVGLLAGGGLVLGGLAVPGAREIWFALAVATPVVLVQDVLRYVLICSRRSFHALVIDSTWVLLGLALMFLAAWQGRSSLWVVGAWAAGGAVATAVGFALTRTTPRVGEGLAWLRDNRSIAARFSAEYASLNASTALVWFALAVPVGASGVAALRGASLLFSPLNTAFNAVRLAMIPELVRQWRSPGYRGVLAETAGVLLALAIGWGLAVLFLPERWGLLLLGDSWAGAEALRLPNFVQCLAMVGYTVALSYFRSAALHERSSLMRGSLAALTLVTPLGAGLLLGPPGAAWGFAGAVVLAVSLTMVIPPGRSRRAAPEPAA